MTEEQFEALKAWIEMVALNTVRLHADGGSLEDSRRTGEAEQRARDLFCGKTHEQPK